MASNEEKDRETIFCWECTEPVKKAEAICLHPRRKTKGSGRHGSSYYYCAPCYVVAFPDPLSKNDTKKQIKELRILPF